MSIALKNKEFHLLKNGRYELRRFQRVKVNLLGRFMLSDKQEYPCQVVEMSPGDAALISPVKGKIGEKIVVYVEEIGRVEGIIARHAEGGFAITFNSSAMKRDKLADQLTWLINRHALNLPEDRRHERTSMQNLNSQAILPNGEMLSCRVLDMSLSGAAIDVGRELPQGTEVIIGNVKGRVVRNLEKGIAVEFLASQLSQGYAHSLLHHV